MSEGIDFGAWRWWSLRIHEHHVMVLRGADDGSQ